MALAVNALTTGSSTTDGTSVSTASFTPTANAIVFAALWSRRSAGTVTDPTMSDSNGITGWVREDSLALNNRKIALFRGMTASPSAATATFNFSETQTGYAWSIFEVTGCDTSGTNGSGAIVQNPAATSGTGTSTSLTLASFGSANNMAVSAGTHDANTATTVGSGFTRIDDVAFAENAARLATQYKLNETAVSDSWSASQNWGIMAVEVKAASTTSIKTINGLAVASVKTVNGLAIASVKTVNGLA